MFSHLWPVAFLLVSGCVATPRGWEGGGTDDSGSVDSAAHDSGSDSADSDSAGSDTGDSDTAVDEVEGSEGLAGGWSVEHKEFVEGALFIHPINTDKDGAMVASRVASALAGLGVPATSDSRGIVLNPTRMADADYVGDVASFIVDELYGGLAQAGAPEQTLITTETLVFTSVHRYGLYVAETLHAPVLPLQFISFAEDWDQVAAAATQSTLIVGQDSDYGGLWLWNKIAGGTPGTPAGALPAAYLAALSEAENVVIVQPDDNWTTCTEISCHDAVSDVWNGSSEQVFLHTSVTRSTAANAGTALYAAAVAAGEVAPAADADVANLKQWEWGVLDSSIENLRSAWAQLGKPADQFVVIRGGVVDMYAWTPVLWEAYLAHNGLEPRGIDISAYWAANPQLERAGAVLPFPSYSWWQPSWHPLDDNGRAILDRVCAGQTCPPEFAANTRAFVNSIGSATDPQGITDLFTDYGLTQENGAYYGYGINAEGVGDWTGWNGEVVPSGWEIVATDLQNPERSPYADRAWTPLSIGQLCDLGPYTCE